VSDWIGNFARDVAAFCPSAAVESPTFIRDDGSSYRGAFASMQDDQTANIEVWWDVLGGWNLTIADTLSQECDSSEESRRHVETLIWLTIWGGCAVVESQHRRYFVADHGSTASAARINADGFKTLREWRAWTGRSPLLEERVASYGADPTWCRIKHV
jgi:hypothetical protein